MPRTRARQGPAATLAPFQRTGLLLPQCGEHQVVQTPSEAQVTVTFGPTSSILLPRAVAYAARYSSDCAEISPGVWRASFSLGSDPEPSARAHRLIQIVGTWRPPGAGTGSRRRPRRT